MWQAIKDGFQSLIDFSYTVWLSMIDFLKDFLFFVIEQLMTIAIGLIDLVGTGLTELNPLTYVNAIPAETQAFMAMAGFNESMGILVTALSIRLIIQLIPFVRWGS